jgi:ABC-type dipeptide/oligopeptide/nickel transport system permease subunit
VLSYNLLGEGIRDALDPRLRQSGRAFAAQKG